MNVAREVRDQVEMVFYPIAGEALALNLVMRSVLQGRALTEADPVAWLDGYVKDVIATMHANHDTSPGQDVINDKVVSYAEVALRTLAENVKWRLKARD